MTALRRALFAALTAATLLAVAVTATACGTNPGKSQNDIIEDIKARNYICVSVKINVPNFSVLTNPSVPVYEGFEIDLAYIIAADIFSITPEEAKLRRAARFVNLDESRREVSLENGNVDMIISSYTINDDRKRRMLFSQPYYTDVLGILTDADGDIKSFADLDQKKVGVLKDSTSEENTKLYINENGRIERIEFVEFAQESISEWFTDNDSFLNKNVDAFISDKCILKGLKNNNPAVTVLPDEFGTESFGVAFKMSHEVLKKRIDALLDTMKEDGSLQALKDKWKI
ncbi:MAG: transporter substrate-binding domain-containing protein [Clostridiaceae bacterium]|jgi:putative glutamine transport system substrate-binding protein|nr:transporter substrate-binding domain-containing protein [Clostridiaceae bacterium]